MEGILKSPRQIVLAAVSFLIVMIAYWLYDAIAVPFIEPVATKRAAMPRDGVANAATKPTSRHDRLICEAFPDERAWQRQRPKIVETDEMVLLVQDYRTLEGSRMELKPCTVIFRPKKEVGGEQRVILLDAPGGAQLQFDSSVDIRRGEFGKLVGGRLVGDVTIRSSESQPGAGDALLLTTRNVQMDAERIWTPHEVAFRYGRNYGRGQDLIITLAKKEDDDGFGDPEKIGGVSSLEIVHLERLHLEIPGDDLPDDAGKSGPGAKLNGPSKVEVTCRGPFIFDLDRRVASFEDQVDVLRLNAKGPSDQLNCRLLEIYFAAKDDKAEQPNSPPADEAPKATQALDAQKFASNVSKIVALGHPVVLRSPSFGAMARGERLEFNLAKKQFLLSGDRPILLEHEGRRIEARSVQYTVAETGQLGEALAAGPGRVHATIDGTPPRVVTAEWKDEMRLKPAGSQHVLSLVGDARVGAENMGELAAAEIHLWLNETQGEAAAVDAKTGHKLNIQPDRLLATGCVKIGSSMLTGSTERFEVWFQNIAPPPAESAINEAAPASRQLVAREAPPPNQTVVARRVPIAGGVSAPLANRFAAPDESKPHSVYDVTGRLLRILLTINGKEMQVRDVSVEGDAQITETKTAEFGAVPFRLTGDAVHMTGADSLETKAVITGKPATISGRGAVLRGATVHVDRAANRAWVPGPGEMALPLDGAEERLFASRGRASRPNVSLEQPKASPPAIVTWREGMNFDGQTVELRGEVIARTPTQRVTAPALDVRLTQHINFAERPQRDAVDVHLVKFHGQVWFENRTIETEELMSIDQLEVRELVIDNQTGNLQAAGPGWLKTVRRGGANSPGSGFAPPAFGGRGARPEADNNANKDSRLTYLRVTFQQGVTGNIHERHVELHEQVRAVYGRVDRWDETVNPDAVDQADADVVLLNSDMLQVAQVGQQASGEAAVELQALGNAIVEGHAFTARAHRISYAQEKDLLIMEGDGRSDAELFRQSNANGQTGRAAARKMLYWPKTGRLDVDTFNSLDFTGPLGPPRGTSVLPTGVGRILNAQPQVQPPSSTPPR